ncbi:uncharacterized protein [Linepithema humile]|uniref:uncharacterized protein isoform X1 n=1 Tax=Linepithema humile TaxID=83485 RepID=UPI00062388E1|nr:PREDICTED: uncharacterized protein LOC105679364 isoform X1 [Linepithema humile]
MSLRSTLVRKYYNDLEYHIKNNVSLKNQINLIKTERIINSNLETINQRVIAAVNSIKSNQQSFNSVLDHIDSTITIKYFLKYIFSEIINAQMLNNKHSPEFDKAIENIWNAIYTLFALFTNSDIQLFFHAAIIESSFLENSYNYKKIHKDNYKELYSCQVLEMIIFKDSDVYAVVNQLKLTGVRLNKIWIQESVQAKFITILRKSFQRTFRHLIHVFRTKEELLIPYEMRKMNIVSIWSEDIVTAKNLAASLNSDIVFINTHMDFFDSVVLLPYTRIFDGPLYEAILHNKSIYENINDTDISSEEHKGPIYDMYYDGTWQKPVKGKYWIRDNCLWANATIEDIHRCIDSAKKGFEIWSTWSIDSRVQTLSKLASILEYKGKSSLSQVVLSWINLSHFEDILSESLQTEKLDIATFCEPRGVIVLTCNDDVTLFSELIQSLVMGNSVIIMCNRFSCALASYYDMFSMSRIPPGVINVLSCENEYYSSPLSKMIPIKQLMLYITRQRKVILHLN